MGRLDVPHFHVIEKPPVKNRIKSLQGIKWYSKGVAKYVTMTFLDCKKAYGMILQIWMIEYLEMFEILDFV